MRGSYGGLLIGALGLAVLDGVISRPGAASNVGGWLAGAGTLVQKFLDPTVPLFSSTATTSATTSSSTSGATVTTIPPATAASPSSSTAGMAVGSVPAFV